MRLRANQRCGRLSLCPVQLYKSQTPSAATVIPRRSAVKVIFTYGYAPAHPLAGRLAGRLGGWPVGWSVGRPVGWPVGRLAGCWSLAGPRVGWSICSPPARLVGSLVTDTAPAITCVGPVCMGLRAWGVRAALERFLVCGPSYVGRLLRVNWTREVHSATFRTLTANRACAYRNRATVFCEHEFRGSGRAGLARPLFRDKP